MIFSLARPMLALFASAALFLLVMSSQFGSRENPGDKEYFYRSLAEFSQYLLEFSILSALIVFSFRAGKLSKLVRWALIPAILFIWVFQTVSLWFSNQPVSPLVIDNFAAAQTIVSRSSVLEALIIGILVVGGFALLRALLKHLSNSRNNSLPFAVASLVLLALLCVHLSSDLSEDAERRISPMHSSALLLAHYMDREHRGTTELELPSEVPADLREFGFRLAPNSEYPLRKTSFFDTPLPFASEFEQQAPSVIVFFVEALSARKLPIYGAEFSDVTPNIDRFAAKSMRVDNYFNHTQSTFRGIKGQLCSSYPVHTTKPKQWANPDFQPPSVRYRCLPHHLNEAGYKTLFLGPDEHDHMHFAYQTRSVGFTHNYYREDITRRYLKNQTLYGPFLTDVQLFQALDGVISEAPGEQPIFVAGYFKDSHVGQDSKPDGLKYGDGSNRILNTLHTFDMAFGAFLKKFEQSERYDNTIIVLTSDHAHWPERPYINMAGEGFNQTPVDEIALLVHSPVHNLPAAFDAGNTSSLAFAPSMAHLLDLKPATNYFLGQSLFEAEQPTLAVAWFNNAIFSIDKEGAVKRESVQGELPDSLAKAWSAISLTHRLELSDSIQPPFNTITD